MKVLVKYVGFSPALNQHHYRILTANGHVDEIYEPNYTNLKEIEMPDEIWAEGSGWADLVCDVCGTSYRERCYPGMVVACPMCSEPELIPGEAILEASNLLDEEV